MKDFILPPYEFPGADFNPRAHAEARLEVGGKKRNFVLKMRDGVIYFKEPSRGQIFAILQLFAPELASDKIGLISVWQREVAAANYGAFITKRDYFQGLPVRGQFLMIVKNDGSGWMKEHFDTEWFLLPEVETPRVYELWNPSVQETQMKVRLKDVKASLLQRTIAPAIREADAVRWIGGSGEELKALTLAAARFFLSPVETGFFGADALPTTFKSHSAFAEGETTGHWLVFARLNANFAAFWRVVERHFRFVGVNWHQGGEQARVYPRPRNENIFQAGIEEWGENWRGNWAPQRGSFEVPIPNLSHVSAHEKLEASVLLRNWLRGKIPDAQIESLLKNV